MSERRPSRVAVRPSTVALAAVAGTWVGHTLEYVRVGGPNRLTGEALGSAHTYMGPVGALLAVAALVGVSSTARLSTRLERRLAELGRPTRDGRHRPPAPTSSMWSVGIGPLVLTLWAWQCGLYVLQENAEQLLSHHRAPGLAVLTGVHALAPSVHLLVAVFLAAGLWHTRRRVTELVEALRTAEARLGTWPVEPPAPASAPGRTWTPRERWGTQLWSRPPPAPA